MRINLHRNKGRHPAWTSLLLVTGALCACGGQNCVYHSYHSLPTSGWLREDTLLFEASVPDSQCYYKLFVEIRNRNNYPYQNLPLYIGYTPEADGALQPADTLPCLLADREGKWLGSGWGGLYQSAFFAGSIRIKQPGTYRFAISSLLPDSILPGINDIGIRLER